MDTNLSLDRTSIIAVAAVVASLAVAWVSESADNARTAPQAFAANAAVAQEGRMKVVVTAPRMRSVQVVGAAQSSTASRRI